MKAARIHQHGGPDVLVYEDVAEPKIKANQVLIRVRACALNHLDLFVRGGIPGIKFPMPSTAGMWNCWPRPSIAPYRFPTT